MPVKEFDCSFLSTEEITMLRQIYADAGADKGIASGTEAAELMALKIMTLFIAGVTDIGDLRREASKAA